MSEKWVVVMTAENEQEGELVEGFLRSQGFACEAESQISHPYPASTGALGEVMIKVPESEAEAAKKLLAEREAMEFPSIESDDSGEDDAET